MISLEGLPHPIPGVLVARQDTGALDAWLGGRYHTVTLCQALPALRAHARGGIGVAVNAAFAGSGTIGRWFAIGDVILKRSEYSASHALPASYTAQDEWVLPVGSTVNVGIAGPLFGHPGGGIQAEWLAGPQPQSRHIAGFWLDRSGNA